jgi:hypothetical protein
MVLTLEQKFSSCPKGTSSFLLSHSKPNGPENSTQAGGYSYEVRATYNLTERTFTLTETTFDFPNEPRKKQLDIIKLKQEVEEPEIRKIAKQINIRLYKHAKTLAESISTDYRDKTQIKDQL